MSRPWVEHVKNQSMVNRINSLCFIFRFYTKFILVLFCQAHKICKLTSANARIPPVLWFRVHSLFSWSLSLPTLSQELNNIKELLESAPKVILMHIKHENYCSRDSDSIGLGWDLYLRHVHVWKVPHVIPIHSEG